MLSFRSWFLCLVMCLLLVGAVTLGPSCISRLVLHTTALQEARESQERLHRWTHKQMEMLLESRKNVAFSQWTDADKDAYRAMRQVLQEFGETWPENPAEAMANRR